MLFVKLHIQKNEVEALLCLAPYLNKSLYADWACSVYSEMEMKWTTVEVYKRSSIKREITARENQARGRTLPYWVAALIQQQTNPEQDHLSPLWSPYKSSTFPLFSSAARKLIKLAFPCCFWQKGWERHPVRCIVGGRTSAHRQTPTAYYSVSTGSATKLLFLPEWYIRSFWFQLSKCCWGETCIWDVCTSSWLWGHWRLFMLVPHISVRLCHGIISLLKQTVIVIWFCMRQTWYELRSFGNLKMLKE